MSSFWLYLATSPLGQDDEKSADIEALVLSGELFNGLERPSSPERSPSPDAGWHDDEINLDHASDYAVADPRGRHGESIGMGPGRTGVKGVIRDRNESERLDREKRAREVRELQRRMERSNLGGQTFLEEERGKGPDQKVDELVRRERQAAGDHRDNMFGQTREGRFGHLREVGLNGFLAAVEKEKGVWVVIHLYDSSLDRCYTVDEILARLARLHPHTKFLRARASALGFAMRKPTQSASSHIRRPPRRQQDDDDDPFDEDKESGDEDPSEDDDVDLDMLPTMLVYRDGELVQNWVRVDWEASDGGGVEELLHRHHILSLPESLVGQDNLGLPSDDENEDSDLMWNSEDEP